MPRRKALDVAPVFEMLATEIARQLNHELQRRWEVIDQRLTRIEQSLARHGGVSAATSSAVSRSRLCAVEGCERAVRAKGLCGAHYQQARYRLSREAEGHNVKSRTNHQIPVVVADSDEVAGPTAVHPIIRRKNRELQGGASETAATESDPAAAVERSPIASSDTAVHPALRPIV